MPLISLFALASLALAGDAPVDPHKEPAPSLAGQASSVDADKHTLLAEMWQRRILSPDSRGWSNEELALLIRMRAAEDFGAVSLLKRRFGLKGLVVLHKPARGPERLRLTKAGYERWRFARTQDAMSYFESKGTDPKWAFKAVDLKGREMFDKDGILSEAGEELYRRALAGQAVHWKSPTGELFGNRPPPKNP